MLSMPLFKLTFLLFPFSDWLMCQITWLDNIGKAHKPSKNVQLENFLTELKRLTITHEQGAAEGNDIYKIGKGGKTGAEGKSQHPEQHSQEQENLVKEQKGENGRGEKKEKNEEGVEKDSKRDEGTDKADRDLSDSSERKVDKKLNVEVKPVSDRSSDSTKLDTPDISEDGHRAIADPAQEQDHNEHDASEQDDRRHSDNTLLGAPIH